MIEVTGKSAVAGKTRKMKLEAKNRERVEEARNRWKKKQNG